MTTPSTASAKAGSFAWFWRATLEQLTASGLRLNAASPFTPSSNDAPAFVLGDELHELTPSALTRRKVRWLLDDVSNFARLTELQVARVERVYSPLLPEEIVAPAHLPKAIFATLLARTCFLQSPPFAGSRSPDLRAAAAPLEGHVRTPEFSLSYFAVTEPQSFVVWHAELTAESQGDAGFFRLAAALGSLRAPAGIWLLPKPLDRLPLDRLLRTAAAGSELIPCETVRAGVAEAARRLLATKPDPSRKNARDTVRPSLAMTAAAAEFLDGGLHFRGTTLSPAEIGLFLNLPLAPETPASARPTGRQSRPRFTHAIKDWDEGRGGLEGLARALVVSGEWNNFSLLADLREALLVVSPTTPAAFVATTLGRVPLTELYGAPSERSRGVAAFGRGLLDDPRCAPRELATQTVLLLCAAVQRDPAAFAARFAPNHETGGLRFLLTAATLAWISRLEWSAPQLPALPERAPDVPGEMLLSAAAALATQGRWTEAHALLTLAHRTHENLLVHPGAGSRFNRLLCWSVVCRCWRDEAQAADARAWVEATDFFAADQSFLVERPAPATPPPPECAGLPRFATPWTTGRGSTS